MYMYADILFFFIRSLLFSTVRMLILLHSSSHWRHSYNRCRKRTKWRVVRALCVILVSHTGSFHSPLVQDLVFLRRIYPRLEVWFQWFNITQVPAYYYLNTNFMHTCSSCCPHRQGRSLLPIDGGVEMTQLTENSILK